MFFFYDIEYLCWLNSLKQLELIEEDGLKILVPEMHLQNYGVAIRMQIQKIRTNGLCPIAFFYGIKNSQKSNFDGYGLSRKVKSWDNRTKKNAGFQPYKYKELTEIQL